jgi:hypothetical protein
MFSELNRLRPTIYAVNLPPVGRAGKEPGPRSRGRNSGGRLGQSGKSGAAGAPHRSDVHGSGGRGSQGSLGKH